MVVKHLETLEHEHCSVLTLCSFLPAQRSGGWKAEMNSWSFHLAKTKGQFQEKPKENIFFSFFPILSPFFELSHYPMKISLDSLFFRTSNVNLFYLLLVWSQYVSPVYFKCTGPAPWHLNLCLPPIPPKGCKGRGHFPAGQQCGELALLPSFLQSWCLVWGIWTCNFLLFERIEV